MLPTVPVTVIGAEPLVQGGLPGSPVTVNVPATNGPENRELNKLPSPTVRVSSIGNPNVPRVQSVVDLA